MLPMSIDDKTTEHELRNCLNLACTAMSLSRQLIADGKTAEASSTLAAAIRQIDQSLGEEHESDISSRQVSNRESYSVLLVEDNPSESALLAAYLGLFEFDVTAVADGLAALRHLGDNPQPDLVIIDMAMPRLNGAKTVTSIRASKESRNTKIVALTGSSADDLGSFDFERAHRGVDRWLRKPVNPEHLVQTLRCVLRNGAAGV